MSGRKEYKNVLYLIDYGLSKKYMDPKTGQHVKFINNRRLNGTARYASIHALEGYETSRRDDLEGLCYVLVYFLNGHLPWGRIKNRNKQERYKIILNMKKKINAENLVRDKNNIEFIEFIKYCRKLKFEEKPNYDYLRGLMINCINKNIKSIDNFYNIDIEKNQLLHSQEKIENKYIKYPLKNFANKLRYSSAKRLKITYNEKFSKEKVAENEEYNDIIINESKSSSLGYIEKKLRSYSTYKKLGIKEIQYLIDKKKKGNDNNILNCKIQTACRNPSNDTKCTSCENHKKTYGRSRFNFIKRSLGIEQKVTEIIKNDSNEQSGLGNNINSINVPNENNNPNNKEDNDRCIIL